MLEIYMNQIEIHNDQQQKEFDSDLSVVTEQSIFDNLEQILKQPFRAEHYVIVLMLSGTVSLQCNLESLMLKTHSLYFIAPLSIYMVESILPDCRFISLSANAEFCYGMEYT